jgi:uncharacterized protein (DUF2336 family)
VAALLAHGAARLAPPTGNHIVALNERESSAVDALLKRPELRPRAAFQMFWHCGHAHRKAILQRFAVGRTLMIEATEDVFSMAAAEGWADPLFNRALKFVDRRQRNREAAEDSQHGGMEGLISQMRLRGADAVSFGELGLLAGISDTLCNRICSDLGGEPAAILCKATGVDREPFRELCAALPDFDRAGASERAQLVYDGLSVEKAQTVLRYWDWAKAGDEARK